MTRDFPRRKFLKAAGTAAAMAAGTMAMGATAPTAKKIKILAVSGSLRKGKTTAAGLRICLDAAKAVDPRHIDVELIELSGLKIDAALAAGFPLAAGEKDDFPALASKLSDPSVAGIIFGSPVYMGDISSVLKAFFERGSLFKKTFALRNKVGGGAGGCGGPQRRPGEHDSIHSGGYVRRGYDSGGRRPPDVAHRRHALEQQGRHHARRAGGRHCQESRPPGGGSRPADCPAHVGQVSNLSRDRKTCPTTQTWRRIRTHG